ncbi:MAG: hypothetical protein WCL00_03880 [Bacteroidota bacterium]
MEQLLEKIATNDFEGFTTEWEKIQEELDESDRQTLVEQIIAYHYDEKEFPYFKKVLDLIITPGFNLNFHTEHWAPTLLCLAVHVVSFDLFDFFLSKGADINFIGDPYAHEEDDYIQNELKLEDRRFTTCLDFAQMKLDGLLGSDYQYQRPDWTGIDTTWAEIEPREEFTTSKRYYAYILEQAQYLYELIHLNILVAHIRKLGGKGFLELNG